MVAPNEKSLIAELTELQIIHAKNYDKWMTSYMRGDYLGAVFKCIDLDKRIDAVQSELYELWQQNEKRTEDTEKNE